MKVIRFASFALVPLCSFLAAAGMGELFLRSALRIEDLFMTSRQITQASAAINSEGWKRVFVRDYGRLGLPTLGPGESEEQFQYDSELGWDTVHGVRGRAPYSLTKSPGVFRAIVVGDSFTWGVGVSSEQSFPRQLQSRLPHGEVLNMGVKGYGIDQATLKYRRYGPKIQHDLLIFAIYYGDYFRDSLDFFCYAKPVFKTQGPNRKLMITQVPIIEPNEVYRRLKGEFGQFSWAYALV